MEYIFIIIISLISLIAIAFVYQIKIKDIKKIKEIGFSKELNNITDKLPENKEICEEILKQINNNSDVKIVEDKNSKTSLYIAITNTISIANIKESFTRVQTIAHECIHSTQNRRILMFNFIYSNFYLLYFVSICLLTLFNKISNPMLQVFILTLFSFIYYKVRSYLETDAMTRAPYVAKEYIEKSDVIKKEELDIVMKGYYTINKIGIKLVNFQVFTSCILKVVIYCALCLI
ncbi:MAG: hypothetical protein HFJ20_05930 [Clostridia bacterium]|nr:hypothetical protein [Clostridia bacterium]